MWRWLALAAALAALGAVWASLTGAPSWAGLTAGVAASIAGLALAARFAALDAEANWPTQIALALRLRWRAGMAPRRDQQRRAGFVRIRLSSGPDLAHAALGANLGAVGIGVDLDHDSILIYAVDDGPDMAAHLHTLEALASGAGGEAAP